jgi:hypothetical protein
MANARRQPSVRPAPTRAAILALAALPVAGVICLLIAGATWGALKATRVVQLAREMQELAGSLRQEVAALRDTQDLATSLETGRATLSDAEALVAELRKEVRPFDGILKGLAWVPVYGNDIAASPYALDMLDALLSAAQHLDSAVGPLLENIEANQVSDPGVLVTTLETIEEADAPLASARAELAAARTARQSIPSPESLSPPLRDAIRDADRAVEALDLALTTIDALPPILGAETPHHILILLQNSDELRPTGGWITSSIYLVIERGQIVELTVHESSDPEIDRFNELRYEEPPAPLRDYMYLPIWAFRDANWSPDFPTSAAKAGELYSLGRQVPVDTVIAIDQRTLHDFLASTGPVTLADGTLVDADNIIDFLQASWEEGYKGFIPELVPPLVDSMLNVENTAEALSLVRTMQRSAEQGNLIVYSSNPTIQTAVESLGWDGSIPLQSSDYLYVVEANIGYNKVNANVTRRMDYHISLTDPAIPYSLLRLEYLNQSQSEPAVCRARERGGRGYVEYERTYEDRTHDCYGDFLRLYLPGGTEMLRAPWFPLPESYHFVDDPTASQIGPLPEDRGKQVFGGLMVVLPGEPAWAQFAYLLSPDEILALQPDGAIAYNLLIQKQPGVPPYPISITVDLPPGATVTSVTPEPTYQGADQLYFETQLRTNLHIGVMIEVPDEMQQRVAAYLAPQEPTPVATSTPRFVPTQPPLPTLDYTPTPSPTPTPVPLEVVASIRLNLRTGPDTSSDAITVLDAGERLEVLGRNEADTWLLVRATTGQEGWVTAELVEGPLDPSSIPVISSP